MIKQFDLRSIAFKMALSFAVSIFACLTVAIPQANQSENSRSVDSANSDTEDQTKPVRGSGQISGDNNADALDVWTVDSLTKVFQDATPDPTVPSALDVARGEYASLQGVFRSTLPVNDLTVRMGKPFALEAVGERHVVVDSNPEI